MLSTKLRSISQGFLFKLFLFIIIFTFVFIGVFESINSSSSTDIVTFNSLKPITEQEYRLKKYLYFSQKKIPLDSENFQEEQKFLQQLIEAKLINYLADQYSIAFTNEDMAKIVKSTPEFLDKNKKFDEEKYAKVLLASQMSERDFLEELKLDYKFKILNHAFFMNLLRPTDFEISLRNQFLNQEYSVRLITADPSKVVSTMEMPSDTDIENYYNKNKEIAYSYKSNRGFKILKYSLEDIKETYTPSESEIAEYYQENIGDFNKKTKYEYYFFANDSKEIAESILIGMQSKTHTKEVESMFFSSDESSINPKVLKELNSTKAKEGFIYEDKGIYKAIKLHKIIPAFKKELNEVKNEIITSLIDNHKRKLLYKEIGYIENLLSSESESLDEIAKSNNLKIQELSGVEDSNFQAKLNDLKIEISNESEQSLLDLSANDISDPIYSNNNNIVYIFQVQDYKKAGILNLDDIRDKVYKDYRNHQNREFVISELLHATNKKEFKALDDSIYKWSPIMKLSRYNAYYEKKLSFKGPIELIEQIFQLKGGEFTNIVEYDGKIYIAEIVSIKENAKNYKDMTKELTELSKYQINLALYQEILQFLKKQTNAQVH
jgi:hypothetical protein